MATREPAPVLRIMLAVIDLPLGTSDISILSESFFWAEPVK